MNPDKPSREQIEARITALLLGELPADEAELLRWTISQDPELQKLHARLLLTVGLVREALAHPADAGEKSEPMKLSDERREKLLAHFKTPRPQPIVPPLPEKSVWLRPIFPGRLIEVLVVVALIAILAAMLLPALSSAKIKARSTSQANATINNLRQIDAAKSEWALEKNKSPSDVPTADDLKPYLVNGKLPTPVMGETYNLGKVSEPVTADVDARQAKQIGSLANRLPSGGAKGQVVQLSADGTVTVVDKSAYGEQMITWATPQPTKPIRGAIINQAVGQAAVTPLSVAPATPPPPAEIVLPKTEPPSVAVVGYATLPNKSGAPPAPPADSFDAGNAGGGGAGGGGGDVYVVKSGDTLTKIARERGTTVQALQAANNLSTTKILAGAKMRMPADAEASAPAQQIQTPALALDDYGLNRSADLNGPQNRGEESRRQVPTFGFSKILGPLPQQKDQNVALNSPEVITTSGGQTQMRATDKQYIVTGYNFQQAVGAASATPAETPPSGSADKKVPAATAVPAYTFSAENTVASAAPVNNKDSDQDFAGYLGAKQAEAKPSPDTSDHRIVGQGNLQLEPSRLATVAESEQVPVLGDVPASGRLFRGRSATSTVEAFDTAAPAAIPASPSTAGGDVMLEFSGKRELAKSDNGTLTVNGNDSFAGGTPINAGKIGGINRVEEPGQTITVYGGVTRDDANGLRALLTTNAVAFNDSEQQKPQEMSARQRFYAQKMNAEPNATPAATLKPQIQLAAADEDKSLPKTQLPPPIPQPEVLCRENNFSTFSLNVSDVSFKLAAASLEKGKLPDAGSIRSEEFINAFDYRDPEAAAGQPLAFVSERARYPFAHNRDLLRFSVKTAVAGRPAGRALNLVLLLDNSGSMERADRVAIIREALRVLATQLQPQDTVSVVTFARTARLWVDGVSGDKAGETLKNVGGITPDGGTNLEEAMRLAYETARRHYLANGMNRVVLLTDGAANLGDVSPADLKQKVEAQRKQGIALDCFGIGFEDFNDDLLEQLSSNGDGRYAFLNSPEDASKEFAAKLAGALQVAAQDVKVQVEFNPQRVISWRQIGYAKHQLTKEQFRDNTVDAAEIAAQEAGNALYTVETKPDGIGPIATVRVRYKVPGTTDYRERSWNVDYAAVPALEQSSAAMRLAATASAFSEWLAASPFAQEVTLDELQKILSGVPQIYGADQRPAKLETMIREAKSISGK